MIHLPSLEVAPLDLDLQLQAVKGGMEGLDVAAERPMGHHPHVQPGREGPSLVYLHHIQVKVHSRLRLLQLQQRVLQRDGSTTMEGPAGGLTIITVRSALC